MDAITVVVLIAAGMTLVVALSFGRMAWRLLRGKDEAVPGGSHGRQMLGNGDERTP